MTPSGVAVSMYVLLGFCAGAVAVRLSLGTKTLGGAAHRPAAHLYCFDVQPGSEAAWVRWVEFEKTHHDATLATLEDESMYFEGVFVDDAVHPKYLYWVAVNGTPNPDAAPKTIDEDYRGLEAATLVKGSRRELPVAYTLILPFLQNSIGEHAQRN